MEDGGAKNSLNSGVVNKRVRPVAVDFDESLATRWWDSDDENDKANEAIWKLFLGVPVSCWRTAKLTERNRCLFEGPLRRADQYKKDVKEYYNKIKELNDILNEDGKFSYVEIWPRFPRPDSFYPWYKMYRMKNTSPTCVKSGQFTQPGVSEYTATAMLQFFSLRFVGNLLPQDHMSVYGFLAVRDDIDYLRNHVFLKSREHNHEISLASRDIPLISPARGIHAPFGVLVEYSIKAMNSSIKYACEVNDYLVIDGCFEFRNWIYSTGNQKHKVRIYGEFGPVDISFGFIMHAVEATIDVNITRAAKGYDMKTLTAFTSGYHDGIMLYKSTSGRSAMVPNDGSPLVVVASHVIAVELHGVLKLVFDIKTEEEPGHSFYKCSGNREVKGIVSTRELSFTAKKHNSCKRVISMGRMFKLVVNVTWSTFGGRVPGSHG